MIYTISNDLLAAGLTAALIFLTTIYCAVRSIRSLATDAVHHTEVVVENKFVSFMAYLKGTRITAVLNELGQSVNGGVRTAGVMLAMSNAQLILQSVLIYNISSMLRQRFTNGITMESKGKPITTYVDYVEVVFNTLGGILVARSVFRQDFKILSKINQVIRALRNSEHNFFECQCPQSDRHESIQKVMESSGFNPEEATHGLAGIGYSCPADCKCLCHRIDSILGNKLASTLIFIALALASYLWLNRGTSDPEDPSLEGSALSSITGDEEENSPPQESTPLTTSGALRIYGKPTPESLFKWQDSRAQQLANAVNLLHKLELPVSRALMEELYKQDNFEPLYPIEYWLPSDDDEICLSEEEAKLLAFPRQENRKGRNKGFNPRNAGRAQRGARVSSHDYERFTEMMDEMSKELSEEDFYSYGEEWIHDRNFSTRVEEELEDLLEAEIAVRFGGERGRFDPKPAFENKSINKSSLDPKSSPWLGTQESMVNPKQPKLPVSRSTAIDVNGAICGPNSPNKSGTAFCVSGQAYTVLHVTKPGTHYQDDKVILLRTLAGVKSLKPATVRPLVGDQVAIDTVNGYSYGRITAIESDSLYLHTANTEPGDSGSPVLCVEDGSWKVFAVHGGNFTSGSNGANYCIPKNFLENPLESPMSL